MSWIPLQSPEKHSEPSSIPNKGTWWPQGLNFCHDSYLDSKAPGSIYLKGGELTGLQNDSGYTNFLDLDNILNPFFSIC